MRHALAVLLISASIISPRSSSAQAADSLERGDAVRFGITQTISLRDPQGRITGTDTVSVDHEGTLLWVRADSLAVMERNEERSFGLDRVVDMRARREVPHPALRGLKRGAIIGGITLGAVGTAIMICNPDLFGQEGCQGSDGVSEVLQGTLAGAAIGAVTFGFLGMVFASKSEWRTMRVTAVPAAPDGSVSLGLRVPVPR